MPNPESWYDALYNGCYQYGRYAYCDESGRIGEGFALAFGFFADKLEDIGNFGFSGKNCPQCGCY